LQLVNVSQGGSLLQDIEEAGKQSHRTEAGADQKHAIQIQLGSLLADITGITEGVVNSAHHQAIDRIGEHLRVNCLSADGIAEGIEWKDKKNRAPLLCVQWHPERIENKNTYPLSKKIRDWFLMEAAKYKL
jgi:putative glutamine amidotransferase